MTYQRVIRLIAGFKELNPVITQILLLPATHSTINVTLLPEVNDGKLVALRQPTIAYIRFHIALE
jgi:hypothetical protein